MIDPGESEARLQLHREWLAFAKFLITHAGPPILAAVFILAMFLPLFSMAPFPKAPAACNHVERQTQLDAREARLDAFERRLDSFAMNVSKREARLLEVGE